MDRNFSLEEMIQAAEDIVECQSIAADTGGNIISSLIRSSGSFSEWDHYPSDDVIDNASGAQYYYHAHPDPKRDFVEHGHFHTFMKNEKNDNSDIIPLTHIIAISMDSYGMPQTLFTVNHWVTGGVWENSDKVETFSDDFLIGNPDSSILVNRWMNSIIKLFKPQIINLIRERDFVINKKKLNSHNENILECRDLEIISFLPISIEKKLIELQNIESTMT